MLIFQLCPAHAIYPPKLGNTRRIGDLRPTKRSRQRFDTTKDGSSKDLPLKSSDSQKYDSVLLSSHCDCRISGICI